MMRATGIALALAIAFAAGWSEVHGEQQVEPATDPYDRDAPGVMEAELRQEPITFELDIPYAATDNPRQRLDLYLPEEPGSDRLPVIVFFHGSGWLQGDKADGAARLMPFLRTGDYAGVSVGYRLSGEATWPAPMHDSKAAIRWVRANADEHGLDPDRIAVWGRSAGAHLALMLSVTGDVPELEGDLGPYEDVTSEVSGVVNFFGVTEMLALIDEPSDLDRTSPEAPEALLQGGALPNNPGLAEAASPITYVSPKDPPVLTLHGTDDRIVPYDQAVRLAKALTEAGVPSYLIPVIGAGHGGFPNEAQERAADFLARLLLDEDVEISTEPLHSPKSD